MTENQKSPKQALNDFFRAIQDLAAEDATLRGRLIDALGVQVLYEGEEQYVGQNPIKQASKWSEDAFKRIWKPASVAQIKAALTDFELATTSDMRGLRKADLLDLLYSRAEQQSRNDGRI
jgi:hypothetical protein